ncbi:MAG: folate-binding protein [Synechococcales bacterium]|nr:folate-binding protein [Synechococcales bacterium]
MNLETDRSALEAVKTGVALCDRSHWGCIEVTDADRLTFLHNQSTNTFKLRQPGEGCDTTFVTSTARTLDLATAYILEDAVLLTVSPELATKIMQFLDRYIFFADKVKLTDVTEQTALLTLMGPASFALLQPWGIDLADRPYGTHQAASIANCSVRVAVGSGLASPGVTLWMATCDRSTVYDALVAAGAVPLSDAGWERLRIEQGRPAPGHELTEDYNPLEAGLWQTISFNKGCYIGQETIARLETYKGVKLNLWGVQLSQWVELHTPVLLGADKIGSVTSLVATESGYVGLVYIRTKAGGAGLMVNIAGQDTPLQDLPFLTRDRL